MNTNESQCFKNIDTSWNIHRWVWFIFQNLTGSDVQTSFIIITALYLKEKKVKGLAKSIYTHTPWFGSTVWWRLKEGEVGVGVAGQRLWGERETPAVKST